MKHPTRFAFDFSRVSADGNSSSESGDENLCSVSFTEGFLRQEGKDSGRRKASSGQLGSYNGQRLTFTRIDCFGHTDEIASDDFALFALDGFPQLTSVYWLSAGPRTS